MSKVLFYEKENGEVPVSEFLKSMDKKAAAKILSDIEKLQIAGHTLREPKSKLINHDEKIYELRSKFPSGISRVLYFFKKGDLIIMTNGFLKKSRKTPTSEIKRAIEYKKDYERRIEES